MGREIALRRGANVLMPILTPTKYREHYTLYEGEQYCTVGGAAVWASYTAGQNAAGVVGLCARAVLAVSCPPALHGMALVALALTHSPCMACLAVKALFCSSLPTAPLPCYASKPC